MTDKQTREELRTLSVLLTSHINNMCNVTEIEKMNQEFISAKDILVSIYKLNANRIMPSIEE